MNMNDRVLNAVHENARAFYEGVKSSAKAHLDIASVAQHWTNFYPGVISETRELFDALVESFISEDVDRHRHETHASNQFRRVRDGGLSDEITSFKIKAAGAKAQSHYVNITPAQMDEIIRVLETV